MVTRGSLRARALLPSLQSTPGGAQPGVSLPPGRPCFAGSSVAFLVVFSPGVEVSSGCTRTAALGQAVGRAWWARPEQGLGSCVLTRLARVRGSGGMPAGRQGGSWGPAPGAGGESLHRPLHSCPFLTHCCFVLSFETQLTCDV